MNRTAVLCFATLLLAGCGSRNPEPAANKYETATVARGSLVLVVEAAGVIEPTRTVELKSKASGEILELGADTGDTVKTGALLVRIDPRIPRNRLDQALAQQNAARAKLANARSQLERGEKLLKNAWINPADYDKLVLDAATAESEVVAAKVAVENARIALDDTDVRAPVAGTILNKRVERGQVISSPTTDVGGGTLLMTMADLDEVRVRTRVDETDIGKLVPGMEARISVASFPGKRFAGTIEKIEPQATVEQNVTLFPVLISLPNAEHLLRPGMNVEARFEVTRRDDVLTVPITALRTERDVATTAGIIGVEEGALREQLTAAGLEEEPRRPPLRRARAPRACAAASGSWRSVQDALQPVAVETGVTDLDRVEVIGGLAEGDVVLVLPSSSLLETQERLQNFMRGRGGIPGITQPSQPSQDVPQGGMAPAPGRRPGAPPPTAGTLSAQPMLEILRVAFTSIRGNLFRAALTMLGVIIGVAAVITMLALGTGAQRAVEQQLEALGANVVTVTTGMRFAQGIARDQQALTTADAEALRCDARHIAAVAPEQSSRQQVKLGNRNLNLSVIGTTHDHAIVNGFELQAGRLLSGVDDSSRRRVAVLGGEVPEQLQVMPEALLGQTILVKSLPFEVVGIYRKKGAIGFGNPDDDVYIPVSTSRVPRGGQRPRAEHRGAGGAGRRPRAGHGGDRARGAPRARPHAGRRQRLRGGGSQAVPRHAAADHADPRLPARRHRGREPGGGRHRHHEHHAGDRHRADARNRHPQGARRDAVQHPHAIPRRERRAVRARRSAGHGAGLWRGARAGQARRLADLRDGGLAAAGVRVQRGRRTRVWIMARAPCRVSGPDRGVAARMTGGDGHLSVPGGHSSDRPLMSAAAGLHGLFRRVERADEFRHRRHAVRREVRRDAGVDLAAHQRVVEQ